MVKGISPVSPWKKNLEKRKKKTKLKVSQIDQWIVRVLVKGGR